MARFVSIGLNVFGSSRLDVCLLRSEIEFEIHGIEPHEDLTFLDSLSHIDGSLLDLSPDSEAQVALHPSFYDPGEGSAIRANRLRLDNLHPRRLQTRIFYGELGRPARHQGCGQPSCKQTYGQKWPTDCWMLGDWCVYMPVQLKLFAKTLVEHAGGNEAA